MGNTIIIDKLLEAKLVKITCLNQDPCSWQGKLSEITTHKTHERVFQLDLKLPPLMTDVKNILLKMSDIHKADDEKVSFRFQQEGQNNSIIEITFSE